MSLLFLKAVGKDFGMAMFESTYKKEYMKYLKTLDAISRASLVLAKENIKHVIFKTIRPYESTTGDIDILVFEGRNNYIRSVRTMLKAGHRLVVYGPRSTTLRDQEARIGIDLYEQVAVSFITYIEKERVMDFVKTTKLANGEYVKALEPEADLACILAHSVIKEQMYTLAEYYSFVHYLEQMNIDSFIKITKQNNIKTAVRTHAAITALLHKAAHKTIPNKLQQILDSLGEENFETKRITKNDLNTPHKYHPITIAEALLEIAKGKTSRNSMATQIFRMSNPNFAKNFLKALMEHVTRKTY